MKLSVQDIVMLVLNPKAEETKTAAIQALLARYDDPKRKWYNLKYLQLGLKEHFRLTGVYPVRDAMMAWLFHAFELGNEEAGAVAVLAQCRPLDFSLEDAEKYICPLITASHPSLESSSVVGDMRIAILGQKRIHYLSYARKVKAMWRSSGIEGEAWRLGRIAVLTTLLARRHIYFRDDFEKALATKARENMQAELSLLGYVPPPPEVPRPAPVPESSIMVVQPGQVPIRLSDIIARTEAAKKGEAQDEVQPPGPDSPPVADAGGTPGLMPSDRGVD
jgi:predicted metal-dependent HD superfamily phosphohydrolase